MSADDINVIIELEHLDASSTGTRETVSVIEKNRRGYEIRTTDWGSNRI